MISSCECPNVGCIDLIRTKIAFIGVNGRLSTAKTAKKVIGGLLIWLERLRRCWYKKCQQADKQMDDNPSLMLEKMMNGPVLLGVAVGIIVLFLGLLIFDAARLRRRARHKFWANGKSPGFLANLREFRRALGHIAREHDRRKH
jgi:hypothetical protein